MNTEDNPIHKNKQQKNPQFTYHHRRQKKRVLSQQDTGQLIASMGIILALSVFFLASISTGLIGSDVTVPLQRSTSPLPEFLHIKETFGLALQYNLGTMNITENHLVFHGRLLLSNVYTNALSKTTREFQQLLLAHNVQFEVNSGEFSSFSLRFQSVTEKGYVYQVPIILEYYDGSTYIKQTVVYSLIGSE